MPSATGRKYATYVGTKIGRLTIEQYLPAVVKDKIRPRFVCSCECGRVGYEIYPGSVIRAVTHGRVGCGCIQSENGTSMGHASTTHGRTGTPEYHAWQHMLARCYRKNDREFHNYGGRGITVCDDWITSFEVFLRDMGPRPGPGYSVERREVDGNYCPTNCMWATTEEQANNKRNSIRITFNSRTQTASQWAKELGVKYMTLRYYFLKGKTIPEICHQVGVPVPV